MASFGYDFRRMWDFFTAGAASGDLPFRVRLNLRFDDPDALNDFLSDGWRTGDGLPFCHVGAVACAAGLEPQRRVAEEAHMAGMQLCLGGSPEDALALIEQLMEKRDIGSRHVIDLGGAAEYVSMDESQIDRMKKIRACAAIAPSASQAGRTRDWASVVHGGIIISAGSGENGLTDPASIIGAVVAGDNSEERISVAEAIGLYTWNSAWNGRNERWRGELSPGCDADMVVLDRDPFGVTPPELSDIKVVMTVCGGCVTYDSGMLGATGAEEISE
jgi:hypothetical protein